MKEGQSLAFIKLRIFLWILPSSAPSLALTTLYPMGFRFVNPYG